MKSRTEYRRTISNYKGKKVFTLEKVKLKYIIGSSGSTIGSNPLYKEKSGWSSIIEENLN